METDAEVRERAMRVVRVFEISHSPDSSFAKCARDTLRLMEKLQELRTWTEKMMESSAGESAQTEGEDSTHHAGRSAAFAAVLGRIDER